MSLTITPVAIQKLKEDLAKAHGEQDQLFRLVADSAGGFGLELDMPDPEDIVIQHDGEAVLLLEKTVAEELTDATLDVDQESDEPEWVLFRRDTSH